MVSFFFLDLLTLPPLFSCSDSTKLLANFSKPENCSFLLEFGLHCMEWGVFSARRPYSLESYPQSSLFSRIIFSLVVLVMFFLNAFKSFFFFVFYLGFNCYLWKGYTDRSYSTIIISGTSYYLLITMLCDTSLLLYILHLSRTSFLSSFSAFA